MDPFDELRDFTESFTKGIDTTIEADRSKSAEDLLNEANLLLADERPLDARTKLLRALEKEPNNYQIHMLLGGYYLVHVGHFRLALKYIKRAEELFYEKFGQPPYKSEITKSEHARLLYFIAETRLNLDNYQGALDVLDQFSSLYFGPWYPGSRAWVLMKLGNLNEAIKVARLGILAGAEPGRTLNILGILLSMTGRRQESLEIFNDAILHEMSLGTQGQPATPLNNSGEVYREIFQEEKAENSWLKATSMPDGCEHVLPSLNLMLLYTEQLKFQKASSAIDNFEKCIAQYPLRNGEEHRALVHLARGRIALHTGNIDQALVHLEEARARRQWFGKIGASVDDLIVAASISLAQALEREANIASTIRDQSLYQRILSTKRIISARIRAWWLFRRSRQILAHDLSNIEDLYVRHTDSLIEYHTLGETLRGYPLRQLMQRIDDEEQGDNRENANPYYFAYKAEGLLYHGRSVDGLKLIDRALGLVRSPADDGLKVHLLLLILSQLEVGGAGYSKIAEQVFKLAPAELRNFGFKLPITVVGGEADLLEELSRGPFLPSAEHKFDCSLIAKRLANGIEGQFSCPSFSMRVNGESLAQFTDRVAQAAFVTKIK